MLLRTDLKYQNKAGQIQNHIMLIKPSVKVGGFLFSMRWYLIREYVLSKLGNKNTRR